MSDAPLLPPTPPPSHEETFGRKCPMCHADSPPRARRCVKCDYHFPRDAGDEQAPAPVEADHGWPSLIGRRYPHLIDAQTRFADLDLPLLIIAIGLPALIVAVLLEGRGWSGVPDRLLLTVAITTPATALLLRLVFAMTDGGEVGLLSLLFKTTALTLGAGGVVDLLAAWAVSQPQVAELGLAMFVWVVVTLLAGGLFYPPLMRLWFECDALEAIFAFLAILIARHAAMRLMVGGVA